MNSPRRKVRLKDVAEAAQVSLTTASFALNSKTRVAAKTREKVEQIAQQLGYVPDPAARALVGNRNAAAKSRYIETIAYIVHTYPDQVAMHRETNRPSLKAMHHHANRIGYRIDTFTIPTKIAELRTLQRTLEARNIRGAIVNTHLEDTRNLMLPKNDMEFVVISGVTQDVLYPTLVVDHFVDSFTLTQKAFSKGYQRPLLVTTRPSFHALHGGYYAACKEFGKGYMGQIVHHKPVEDEVFLESLLPLNPDALFVQSVAYEVGDERVLKFCHKHKWGLGLLDVPRQTNSYSGLRADRFLQNQLAVDILHGLLTRKNAGIESRPFFTEVPSKWIEGETL